CTNENGFFQKGDKVKHKTLGLGVVEAIMQDLIQVRFINSEMPKQNPSQLKKYNINKITVAPYLIYPDL
ncbi:hypothetical protein, partial [Candidatus Phytoplasma asteris]|uniref:hypothetical protein n=1 Tax=Candidatus Phytoplasma asteris TaxID=85620 RepID=UPI0039E0A008